MKRLNPETNAPYRCGDADPTTGLVFRCYDMTKMRKDGTYVENWLMPDVFDAVKTRMRNRARARREADYFKRMRTADQIIASIG
jgi:hypothetical protein